MKVYSVLALVAVTSTAVGAYSVPPKTRHVEIEVGNTIAKIPASKARPARTGQKKIFYYTLFANQLSGSPDAIQQVEFFPDIVDDTYLPRSYTAQNGPRFTTRHDCWGMSTACLKVTMRDGSVKTLYYRIRGVPRENAKFRLVYKPFRVATGRAFGVEMELLTLQKPGKVRDSIKHVTSQESLVTGWNDKTMKAWKVETDNTIRSPFDDIYGVEIVSPILRGEAGLDFIRKVAQQLSKDGADVNDSCGLHVHVDLTGVNFAALKRICQNWIKYEEALDLLLPSTRHKSYNEHCLAVRDNMRFADKTNKEAHDLIALQTTIQGLARLMNAHAYGRSRYFKLNLQNLVDKNKKPRNTIEFRGHAGTCNADDIEMWVRLLNAFVEASIKKEQVDPFKENRKPTPTLKRFFSFIEDSDLKAWYM